MRLGGGVPYDGDPPTMSAAGNDYAELCDLGPSRWSSRGYYHAPPSAAATSLHPSSIIGGVGGSSLHQPQSASSVPTGGSAGLHHYRGSVGAIPPSSYEAEDIGISFGGGMLSPPSATGVSYGVGSRVGNSTSSLRASGVGAGGRTGLYYSPPGTSYTIVEREQQRPHSPHYYFNSAGAATKGGSLPGRGSTAASAYLSSSPSSHMTGIPSSSATGTLGRHGAGASGAAANGNKKRPISPEQVLRMFGATQSSSVPTSSYHYSNGTRDRTGRRSPASSPPSTTHQVSCNLKNSKKLMTYNLKILQMYRERERDRSITNIHELSTRTVNMSRDQTIDHGFGICVKGGKDSGM